MSGNTLNGHHANGNANGHANGTANGHYNGTANGHSTRHRGQKYSSPKKSLEVNKNESSSSSSSGKNKDIITNDNEDPNKEWLRMRRMGFLSFLLPLTVIYILSTERIGESAYYAMRTSWGWEPLQKNRTLLLSLGLQGNLPQHLQILAHGPRLRHGEGTLPSHHRPSIGMDR